MENSNLITITLKAARVNAGLTLEQAGNAIGRDKNTISSWENNKTKITKIDFDKLCKIYNMPELFVKQPFKEGI